MSQSNSASLYEPLDQLLTSYGAIIGASEFHGLLVGALCCGANVERWLTIAEDNLDIPEQVPAPLQMAGKEMYGVFDKLLAQRDYEFQLLLPPLEVELELSTRCLGEWVTGFLSAMGESGIKADQLSRDSQELLGDMAAIAQISIEGESDSEQDLIEVVEYVRVAVFSLYEELTDDGADQSGKTIH